MIRKTLILFAILGLTVSALAVGGTLSVEPETYNLDLNAGDQVTKNVELTWNGKDNTTIYIDSSIMARETNAKGINVSNEPKEIVLNSGQTADIQVNVSSSFGLVPDNFTIETVASAESIISGEAETVPVENLEPGENLDVQTDKVKVEVDPADSTNVTVKQVERVFVDPPSERSFVRGVQVEGDQNLGGGQLIINYEQNEIEGLDEGSLQLYLYNESEGDWEAVESDVNNQENFVVADVPHFSTYAAYGAEEEDIGGGGGTVNIDDQGTQDDQDQTENDSQQNDTQTSDDQQTEDDQDQTDQTDEQNQDQTENQSQGTSPPNENPGQTNGLTARFTESPGSIGLITALLLIITVVGLDYSGKIDVQERVSELKN